jgi:hypothetical protein
VLRPSAAAAVGQEALEVEPGLGRVVAAHCRSPASAAESLTYAVPLFLKRQCGNYAVPLFLKRRCGRPQVGLRCFVPPEAQAGGADLATRTANASARAQVGNL